MEKTYPDFDRNNFEAVSAAPVSARTENILERGALNKVGLGQCCNEPQMKGHGWRYVTSSTVGRASTELKKYDRCQVNARTCRCLMHVGDACIHLW